jgi:putative addiction module component (TIGR02574 family)
MRLRITADRLSSMTTAEMLEHLRAEAMKLPEEERRELVRSLQETLSDGDDDDISPAWRDELSRRRASLRDGSAQLVPAAEVIAELRARFRG